MKDATQGKLPISSYYKNIVAAGKIRRETSPTGQASTKASSQNRPRRKIFEVFCAFACVAFFSSAAFAHGLSSVQIGASVQFRHYELVRMLDQHFTVEMPMGAKPACQQVRDGNFEILIVQ